MSDGMSDSWTAMHNDKTMNTEWKVEQWEGEDYIITGFGLQHPSTFRKSEAERICAILKLATPLIICAMCDGEGVTQHGALDAGEIAKHICNSFRKWELSGAGSHVHVYEALKPLTARIAELEQKKEHAVGIPAFPQSITEAAKRHQQQPEQMEALIQRVKELGQECSRIQSEYDEFKRAALTLTSMASIELVMKVKP